MLQPRLPLCDLLALFDSREEVLHTLCRSSRPRLAGVAYATSGRRYFRVWCATLKRVKEGRALCTQTWEVLLLYKVDAYITDDPAER